MNARTTGVPEQNYLMKMVYLYLNLNSLLADPFDVISLLALGQADTLNGKYKLPVVRITLHKDESMEYQAFGIAIISIIGVNVGKLEGGSFQCLDIAG